MHPKANSVSGEWDVIHGLWLHEGIVGFVADGLLLPVVPVRLVPSRCLTSQKLPSTLPPATQGSVLVQSASMFGCPNLFFMEKRFRVKDVAHEESMRLQSRGILTHYQPE